jgi:hypothetical protein
MKTPDNKLEVGNTSTLAGASLFDADGNEMIGHLSVDDEGVVRFIPHFPDHDPSKE